MVPRKQAGHMTCTRPQAERQIILAMRAPSTHDPKGALDARVCDVVSSCLFQTNLVYATVLSLLRGEVEQ